ncbi:uncharacterized protein LOC116415938 [Nasonia vitripennis]|uniref:Chromo domain-containing protein n=1 Tax=Nasonia vitripennis TaxID=7425 RepID=A0A7M7PXD0_NASVI|nr:uncharacterized protein LOC116415938 [Nasonia vitripennis]
MERQRVAEELHKPARRRYKRRKYDIRGIDETWQADLVEMIPYSKENKDFHYLLTVIDIFSKYAWAVPVKSKSEFSKQGSYKWLNILPNLLKVYNSRKHRTTGIEPKNVNQANEREVKRRFPNEKSPAKKTKFKVGDKVRISKIKNVFEKGYTPNWSTEIFTITPVIKTNPITYHLKDYYDKPVSGGFYEIEIHKTLFPEIYLVEKVLKKSGKRVFVKWLGFSDEHNSWINKNEIL